MTTVKERDRFKRKEKVVIYIITASNTEGTSNKDDTTTRVRATRVELPIVANLHRFG